MVTKSALLALAERIVDRVQLARPEQEQMRHPRARDMVQARISQRLRGEVPGLPLSVDDANVYLQLTSRESGHVH